MKKNKKKGIILITTLIFMTLTFMLAVMICKNGKESLFAGNRYAENEQAYLTALSGIEYIKEQLYNDKDWKVSKVTGTSSFNGILIEKKDNIITGYILTSSGTVSNTNYDSKFEIFDKNNSNNRQYKTINNLTGSSTIKVDQNNSTTSLNSNEYNKRTIPAKSFYAYVKGTCGKTVRYAEAILISDGPKSLDGGSVINGKVNIIGNQNEEYNEYNPFVTISNKNKYKKGKITSSNQLTLKTNTGINDPSIILNSSNNNHVRIASKGIKIGDFNGTSSNDKSSHIEYDSNPPKINEIDELSSVDKASNTTDNSGYEKLKPGTYAFINDLDVAKSKNKKNTSKWVYIPNKTITTETDISDSSIKDINNSDYKNITFKKNTNDTNTRTVEVKGKLLSEGSINFIVLDKTTKKVLDTSTNNYKKVTNLTPSTKNTIDFSITNNGIIKTKAKSEDKNASIIVNGEITGTGKIYCDGNLTMNAGSVLETKAQSGIAIWAKGNVNVKEAKNLSADSAEIEKTIISEALEQAKHMNITSINGENNDEVYDTEDIDNSEDLQSIANIKESLQDSEEYTEDEEEQQASIIINGQVINVNSADYINPTTNSSSDSISFTSFGGTAIIGDWVNYELKMEGDIMTIYRYSPLGTKKFYITEESIKNETTQSMGLFKSLTIEDYQANENDNYNTDKILKINGYEVGILDTNIYTNYKDSKYKITNSKFLFSQTNYDGTPVNDPFAFPYDDTNNNNNTNNTNANNNTTGISLQEFVENYYKERISDTYIKGSIYSKNGNITIKSNRGDFTINGALLTANATSTDNKGNLNITGCRHTTLIYDPDYVPFFKDEGILTTTIFKSIF